MIKEPTLILNEAIARKNIQTMVQKAERNKIALRPHFKTHQSHEIGRWFREYGIKSITVSSLKMAVYFAEDGWDDITVAFPVNVLEIDRINLLAQSINLNLLVESPEAVQLLNKQLKYPVNVFIKTDTGYHRTGVDPTNYTLIDRILEEVEKAELISFRGFLAHAGHSYDARGIDQIAQVHNESIARILSLKEHYKYRYPELALSVGDTPTCSRMEDFSGVDEIRPGNFVFYDLTQALIGSCTEEQVAVAMACPVVAIHEDRNEILVYGGGVHFSKDRIVEEKYGTIFGKVVTDDGLGWGRVVEGAYMKKLSQEHGTIYAPKEFIAKYKVGDIIKVLPVHSCMTADLMKKYLTTEGNTISMLS
jgi:D-serine deaminase-like pyridoxal phosphate-dependent protein